jgi:hypothetical protein
MPRLLPRMAYEAPPSYVSFVERHIDTLRRDAATVVGDEYDADRLYPDVLTDVAARWTWLELARTLLGRSGAADRYLHRSFARRSMRWHAGQWGSEEITEIEVRVWRPDEPSPLQPSPRRRASSVAERLAPQLAPERPRAVAPIAEAAVAWWHAYEAWRRRWVIAGCVAVFVLLALAGRTPPEALRTSGALPPAASWSVAAADAGPPG